MNDESESDVEQQIEPNQLWILLREGDDDSRLAIARVEDQNDDPKLGPEHGYDGVVYECEILYDTIDALETPFSMSVVPVGNFYAQLPDHDEWDEKYEDLIDTMLGWITRADAAEVLAGESIDTNGERGYEAARFFVLDGISESLTEYSVSHGHGASRYARAVEMRVENLPTWLAESVLYSEQERWDGGFELSDDAASKLVELLMLREKHLDEDNEEEIRELVQDFDLEYDEYREVEC